MLESHFSKVGGLKACSVIEKRLGHRFFSVKFAFCEIREIFKNTFFHGTPPAAASKSVGNKKLYISRFIYEKYREMETNLPMSVT